MTSSTDASIDLVRIGAVKTGFLRRADCPSSARHNPDSSSLEIDPAFSEGLLNIELASHLIVLYWLDKASRKVLHRKPLSDEATRGVFASRSPNRPNPIGVSVVRLLARDGNVLTVSGLDCIDGTAIVDIKPYSPADDRVDDATVGWDACPGRRPGARARSEGLARC